MAFDQSTRNRLQRFVTDVRRTLEEEFTRQLQNDYGELVSMLSDTVPFPARWKGNGSSLERDDGCRF